MAPFPKYAYPGTRLFICFFSLGGGGGWRREGISVMGEVELISLRRVQLGGVYMIMARLSFQGEMKSCTVFT